MQKTFQGLGLYFMTVLLGLVIQGGVLYPAIYREFCSLSIVCARDRGLYKRMPANTNTCWHIGWGFTFLVNYQLKRFGRQSQKKGKKFAV
jgi:hypothetical protein